MPSDQTAEACFNSAVTAPGVLRGPHRPRHLSTNSYHAHRDVPSWAAATRILAAHCATPSTRRPQRAGDHGRQSGRTVCRPNPFRRYCGFRRRALQWASRLRRQARSLGQTGGGAKTRKALPSGSNISIQRTPPLHMLRDPGRARILGPVCDRRPGLLVIDLEAYAACAPASALWNNQVAGRTMRWKSSITKLSSQ